jgi:FkbM family methyltransferase
MFNFIFRYFNRVIFLVKNKIFFQTLFSKIQKYLRNMFFAKSIKSIKPLVHDYNLLRLGSEYGGWTFIKDKNLKNSVIISCGAGEDVSFDIDFINYYSAKVILVDPTPRAISHYNKVIASSGQPKKINIFDYGRVSIEAYDLTNINRNNLILINKAVDIISCQAKFYSPKISTNTSSSLIKEGMYDNKSYILVDTISIKDLIIQYHIQNIPLIKLDIKKKEIEVIKDLIIKKIFPKQILVDFEGLFLPSKASIDDFKRTHEMLLQNNYKLINIEDTNYSYAII